jgi:hypothetical protein
MSSSNSSSDTSVLRSQAEFFLGGTVPVAAQPDNCSICTEPQDTDVIKILACGHTFHLLCVLEWFKSNSARRGSCPNCRCELHEPDPLPTPATAPTMDDEMEETCLITRMKTWTLLPAQPLGRPVYPASLAHSSLRVLLPSYPCLHGLGLRCVTRTALLMLSHVGMMTTRTTWRSYEMRIGRPPWLTAQSKMVYVVAGSDLSQL